MSGKEFFDEASAQFVCDFVSRLPTTDTGLPFQLYDWQTSAIREFYGTMVQDEDGADGGRALASAGAAGGSFCHIKNLFWAAGLP